MKKADLEKLEALLMEEVVKRRQLGGYSADAAGLLFMGEALMRLFQHIIERTPDDDWKSTDPEAIAKPKKK